MRARAVFGARVRTQQDGSLLRSYEMQPWDNELNASLVPDFDKGEVRPVACAAQHAPKADAVAGATVRRVATSVADREYDGVMSAATGQRN